MNLWSRPRIPIFSFSSFFFFFFFTKPRTVSRKTGARHWPSPVSPTPRRAVDDRSPPFPPRSCPPARHPCRITRARTVCGSGAVSDSAGVAWRPLSIPGLETDPEVSVDWPVVEGCLARRACEGWAQQPSEGPSRTGSWPLMAGCALPTGCPTDARFHHPRAASHPIFVPAAGAVRGDGGAGPRADATSGVAAPEDRVIWNWKALQLSDCYFLRYERFFDLDSSLCSLTRLRNVTFDGQSSTVEVDE